MVRPTSARVRTALFDMLAAFGLEGRTVLDLYAGNGTLGMEALQRGAQRCDFVECEPRLCSALKASLEAAGLKESGQVLCMKVERALAQLKGPYDIVLMDPPYEMQGLKEVVERVGESGLIAEGGLLVVEHSKRVSLVESYGELRRWRSRRYGDTMIGMYVRGEATW